MYMSSDGECCNKFQKISSGPQMANKNACDDESLHADMINKVG